MFPEKHNVLASKTMLTGFILFNITNVFCLIYLIHVLAETNVFFDISNTKKEKLFCL